MEALLAYCSSDDSEANEVDAQAAQDTADVVGSLFDTPYNSTEMPPAKRSRLARMSPAESSAQCPRVAAPPETAAHAPAPLAGAADGPSCAAELPAVAASTVTTAVFQETVAGEKQVAAVGAPGSTVRLLQALPEPPRVRAFPHVDGNWPAITYITVTDPQCVGALESLAAALVQQSPAAAAGAGAGMPQPQGDPLHLWPVFTPTLASLGSTQAHTLTPQQLLSAAAPSEEQSPKPLHLSLSRTVAIRHIQADSLRAALTKQLRPFRSCTTTLSGLTCLLNENKSRTFVGIKVAAGAKQVLRLIEAVDRAFAIHGLPSFYEEPLPHISLAWTPGDRVLQLQQWLAGFPHLGISLKVQQVVCQIGKVKEVVWQGF